MNKKCASKPTRDTKHLARERREKLISATIAADDEADQCDNRHNRRRLNSFRRRLGLLPVLSPKQIERSLPAGTGYRVADDGAVELIDLDAVDNDDIDEDDDDGGEDD